MVPALGHDQQRVFSKRWAGQVRAQQQWYGHAYLIYSLCFGIDFLTRKGTTWSYNQGVILGGLVEMFNITGDSSYLLLAINISRSAMSTLVDKDGVFSEVCDGGQPHSPPPPPCVLNDDARIFKGIFVRYLARLIPVLHQIASSPAPSAVPPALARSHLSDITAFVERNFAHVTSDLRNSATWGACDAAPMPRPSPGAVWQSARESVFAGYTSTLSSLDLVIVRAIIQDSGHIQ